MFLKENPINFFLFWIPHQLLHSIGFGRRARDSHSFGKHARDGHSFGKRARDGRSVASVPGTVVVLGFLVSTEILIELLLSSCERRYHR